MMRTITMHCLTFVAITALKTLHANLDNYDSLLSTYAILQRTEGGNY